jgi:hypothetical protein
MITFVGGPMDGELVEEFFFPYDEIHIDASVNDLVYIYSRNEETMNYDYEGEFESSETQYEEDEDE